MTYIVNDKCIKCKLMDCVEVCPVDCFYEGKNMLVIKPDECIDCGVCEPECPIDAIVPDTESGTEKWLEINTKYSEIWPNISQKKESPYGEKLKDEENNRGLLIVPPPSLVEQMYSDFKSYGWKVEKNCHRLYSGYSNKTTKITKMKVTEIELNNRSLFIES